MREDESSPPLGTIDPKAMRRFGMWMAKGPSADRVRVFEEITDGDELGGLALVSLCDLELCSALEGVKGERESFDGWFSLAEITKYCEDAGGDAHNARYLVGALVDLADTGLVLMRSEPSTYRGGYIGSSIAFRVYWPFVLDSWDTTLDRLFRPDGYVYLLGGNEFYKIGCTKDVDARVKQLSIQLPWPVELEHAFPCEGHVEAEKALQEMYAEYRSNGEWFHLPMEAVAYIKGIKRMRGAYVEPLETELASAEAVITEEDHSTAREPKPGETYEYKHYKVEEGFALVDPEWGKVLPFTFAESAWEAENRFWTGHPEAAAKRDDLILSNAVRVTDTYIDYKSAGDPRHLYSWSEWERRKRIGIDMYD